MRQVPCREAIGLVGEPLIGLDRDKVSPELRFYAIDSFSALSCRRAR